MATKSIISLRGSARIALALLFSVCLCQGAGAQTNMSVVATGPYSAVASHPATWGQQWETAISSKGDLFTVDFQNGGLYLFPAGGGAMVTLIASGNTWTNPGIAIDPWDNLWIGLDWNNEFERIPYANGTWNMSDPNIITYAYFWNPGSQAFNTVNTSIPLLKPFDFSFSSKVTNASNGTATMAVGDFNSGAIDSFAVDSKGNVLSGTVVVSTLAGSKAEAIAVDNSGNIYFVEQGGTPGVLLVPAGTTNATDTKLTRVDPNLSSPDGVTVDSNGNVYVSDSKTGVYLVPNVSGTVSPSDAVLMDAIPAFANVDFDLVRGIMYVPTTYGLGGGWTSPSGTVYNDFVAVALSNVGLGDAATGVQGAPETINVGFAASTTLENIEIVEAGGGTDFTVVGGTCKTGTTYKAGETCTVEVALNSKIIGNVSAKLELLDSGGNILASLSLSGIGLVPAVVSGPISAVASHPATWGQQWETAISSKGDLFTVDFQNGGLYLFPAGGGAMVTLIPGGSCGYCSTGIALDPWDNLWIGLTWNDEFERIPYANATWNMSDPNIITYAYSWLTGSQAFNTVNTSIPFMQVFDFSFSSKVTNASNGTATMAVGDFHSPAIDSFAVDSKGNVLSGTVVVSTLAGSKAEAIAVDNSGNIYFVEQGGTPGVLLAPAGTTNATDTKLTRVDPNLSSPDGVTVDSNGNIYVSDSKAGVYLVPNENGTVNPSDAYLLAAVPAFANVDFDVLRGIMYVPTAPGASGGWNGINDIAAVALANVHLGSAAAGSQGASSTVNFGLSAGVTPAKFTIEEAGAAAPDLVVASGGSCVAGTAYEALSTCSVNVALSPHAAGGVSGKLLMLDGTNNVIASMALYGTAQGAVISGTPAFEQSIGAGLMVPGQVAADAASSLYVADSGLKKVLMYPAGAIATTAGVSVGTGLTAPTGVAVDGAGDVFIADSGKVYEVPYTPTGLNTAGQITLKTGLGAKLNLATDALGNLYVADPNNARVVKLGNLGGMFGALSQTEIDLTGFTAPAAVAVDGSNSLYVADGSNLIEVQPNGTRSTLLTTLSNTTGLAVDLSGAVYISSNGGTKRVPYVSGALSPSTETVIGATVTDPTSVALDRADNAYLADGTALNLHLVSASGWANTGSPALGSTGSGSATLTNIGTSTLNVTGFLLSDSVDFSASGCSAPVAPMATCTVNVTMDPEGPGVQGPISSVITAQGNAANSPVGVVASGTAGALAGSTTTLTIPSTVTVLSIPISITVASTSGTGATPTGNVVISLNGVAQPPVTLTNGKYAITLVGIPAGNYTFNVQYIGDRVYGASSASVSRVVGKVAAPVLTVPNLTQPAYVLSQAYKPYDNSLDSYLTNYVVKVNGVGGLMPTGTISFMQGSTVLCGPNGPPTNSLPTNSFSLDATGSATFPTSCLQISQNSVAPNEITPQTITSIVYSGDANYAPVTVTTTNNGSPILFQELRQPSVLLTPSPLTVAVPAATYPAEASVATTLTVTSLMGYGVSTNAAWPASTATLALNNYTLPLGFSCQGLPAHATCTFSGGNYTDINGVLHPDELVVNTNPSLPGTIKVTITTNVPVGTTTSQNSHSAPFELAAMFGVGLLSLAFGRKSGRKGRFLLMICLLVLTGVIGSMTTACSTQVLGTSPVLNTPPSSGTPYSVMVTAQQVGSVVIPGSQGPVTLYGNANQMSVPYSINVVVQ